MALIADRSLESARPDSVSVQEALSLSLSMNAAVENIPSSVTALRPNPRVVPARPYLLEVTSVFLGAIKPPPGIFDDVLEFLKEHVTAAIVRVDLDRYFVVADVYGDSLSTCSAKLTLWTTDSRFARPAETLGASTLASPSFVLEFQRMRGDGLCFCDFFNRARQFLQEESSGLMEDDAPEPWDFWPSRSPSCSVAPPTEELLVPLLEMAGCVSCPSIQAEAAIALATLAEQDSWRPLLCTEKVLTALKCLLRSGDVAVTLPTVTLLQRLLPEKMCRHLFEDVDLWQLLLQRLHDSDSELLSCQLLELVVAVVHDVADALAPVARVLSEVLHARLSPSERPSSPILDSKLRQILERLSMMSG
jgi:hypothetical protein